MSRHKSLKTRGQAALRQTAGQDNSCARKKRNREANRNRQIEIYTGPVGLKALEQSMIRA